MNVPRPSDMLRTQPMQPGMLNMAGAPFLGSQGGPQPQPPNHIGMMPGNHTGANTMGGLLNGPNNPNFSLQLQQQARLNPQRAHVQQGMNPALGPGSHLGPSQIPGVAFPNPVMSQNTVRRVQSQPGGLNQAAGQFGGGIPGPQMLQGMNGIPGMGMPGQMRQPMQQGPPGPQMRMPPQHSIPGGGMPSDMQMQINRQGTMGGGSAFAAHLSRAPSQNPSMSNISQPPSLPPSHSGGIQQPQFPTNMVLGGQPMHPQQAQHLSSSPHQVQQGPAGALPNNMAGTPGLPGASPQQRITPDRVYSFSNPQMQPHMQPGVPRMAPGGVPIGFPSASNTPNPQVGGNQPMGDLAQQLGGGNMVGQQRSASRQSGNALLSTPVDVLQNMNGTDNHSASFMSPHHLAGPAPPRPSSRPRSQYPMAPQQPQQQTPHQPPMAIHRSPRQPDMPHQLQMQPPGPPRQATPAQSPHRVGMSNTPRVAPSQLPQGPHHPNRTPSLAAAQPQQGVIPPPKPPTPAAPPHSQQVPITSRPQQPPPAITSQAPHPPTPVAPPPPVAQETGPSAPSQQPHPPIQPQQALAPRPAAVPQYAVGNGQSVTRLLQFSGALSKLEKSTSRLQLSHWETLVKEYFTSRATMKLTLWKENQQYEAKPFEIGTPIIPRFFLVTAQSGVQCMSINLDGARERLGSATHSIVECVQAVWTYKYDDGWTIKLKGPMTAHILVIPNPSSVPGGQATGTYTLKFDQIQFDAKNYERLLAIETFIPKIPLSPPEQNTPLPEDEAHNNEEPRRVQVGEKEYWQLNSVTVPVSPINAFGIPQATMRCLELAESVTQMADLIQFSREKSLGPKDALREFAKQIRERQGQEGVGPSSMMNGVPGPHRLQQPTFPGGVGPYGPEMNGGVPAMPPSTSSTLLSGPSQANQGPLPPLPQQNGPPPPEGTPKMNKALPPSQQPIASASTPSASTPSASTPSAATMTPIPAPLTLKRKAGDSSSPNIANAEQPSQGKRARGKRRSTNTG